MVSYREGHRAAPIRMARRSEGFPFIPVELWGRVARHMTLREYCMLASTCKALWTMNPPCLEVVGWSEQSANSSGPGDAAVHHSCMA